MIGSLKDYEINDTIYHPNSFYGKLFACIGVAGGFILYSFYGGYLLSDAIYHKEKGILKILFIVVGIALMIASIFYSGKELTGYNGLRLNNKYLGILFISPLYLAIDVFGFLQGKKNDNDSLCWIILGMGIVILLANGVVINVIKALMHRPRYRMLIHNDCGLTQADFRNWFETFSDYKTYIDLGIAKDEFRSFPSGHTCSANLLMMGLCNLCFFDKKLKNKRMLLTIIGLAWVVLTGFSRMLVGAHYLSDVSFGFLIGFIFYCIQNEILENKILKLK